MADVPGWSPAQPGVCAASPGRGPQLARHLPHPARAVFRWERVVPRQCLLARAKLAAGQAAAAVAAAWRVQHRQRYVRRAEQRPDQRRQAPFLHQRGQRRPAHVLGHRDGRRRVLRSIGF